MTRLALAFLSLLSSPALAHDGLHHHPHGVEFGWLSVALIGAVVGGLAVALVRGRK